MKQKMKSFLPIVQRFLLVFTITSPSSHLGSINYIRHSDSVIDLYTYISMASMIINYNIFPVYFKLTLGFQLTTGVVNDDISLLTLFI